jgi:hypothetical protein
MNNRRLSPILFALGVILLIILAACGAPATPSHAPAPSSAPAETQSAEKEAQTAEPTRAPEATKAPEPTTAPAAAVTATQAPRNTAVPPTAASTATPGALPPTPAQPVETAPAESRLVELEWPQQMRLGDSDIVRMALMPSQEGYTVTAEFPEHQTVTRTVSVRRPGGYDLSAIGRLDAVGFELSPQGDQAYDLLMGEVVTWRWTLTPRNAGQHRLSVSLLLRWTPQSGTTGAARESTIFSRGLNVDVTAPLGLTTSQAATTGLIGLVLGGSLGSLALFTRKRAAVRTQKPNPKLAIEPHPGLRIRPQEDTLLRTLFRRYARLVVESEFRSGYSGARTLLALPIHADGRADAYTIAKIGDRESIQREFENYETYVKDTLPPITARIQEPPVTVKPAPRPRQPSFFGLTPAQVELPDEAREQAATRAVLRYTFIGEPGHNPISLREALLANPDPALLTKLFDTFGPNWWMQRRPYTFRLAQEYDRVLPAHYVLEPVQSWRGRRVGRHTAPADLRLELGDRAKPRGFKDVDPRAEGEGLSLTGTAMPGQPPLRLRWLSTANPDRSTGKVVNTRLSLLRGFTAGFDLCGLPDPLLKLPALLDERVTGSRSTIHGDLNLENVLVGPGGFVWLIDFAQTRDGHPLFDFAHLEAEVIAHIITPRVYTARDFVKILDANDDPLLNAIHGIAERCLFNTEQPREYYLALTMACLGALKYNNLLPLSKQLLYVAAAYTAQYL